jgi:LysR family transcriptional regulator, glycine cleavage system transcriptional activator
MPQELPSLNALRCFEAAGRLRSFARAAEELHVTAGAVSRQIRQLEDDLGVALFERRNRRVRLTAAGQTLHKATEDALNSVREAVASVRSADAPGLLVLSCEPTLTQRWLIPRLPRLKARCPRLLVHVLAAGGPVRFERDRVDVAIRRDDFEWPSDTYADPIIDEYVGPVCSPALARNRPPQAILALPTIHSATRPDAWQRWLADSGRPASAHGGQTFEHFFLSIEAAVAALGVAIGPYPLVADDLAAGRLVAPFGFRRSGHRYMLLTRRPLRQIDQADCLVAWLREEARELASPPGGQSCDDAPRVPASHGTEVDGPPGSIG